MHNLRACTQATTATACKQSCNIHRSVSAESNELWRCRVHCGRHGSSHAEIGSVLQLRAWWGVESNWNGVLPRVHCSRCIDSRRQRGCNVQRARGAGARSLLQRRRRTPAPRRALWPRHPAHWQRDRCTMHRMNGNEPLQRSLSRRPRITLLLHAS